MTFSFVVQPIEKGIHNGAILLDLRKTLRYDIRPVINEVGVETTLTFT